MIILVSTYINCKIQKMIELKDMKFKEVIILLSSLITFTMCSDVEPKGLIPETELAQKDSIKANEQLSDTSSENKKSVLTSSSLENIPIELQNFIHAITDIEKIANYIDTTTGCYLIEEGPGIYPVFKIAESPNDLIANSEFLLLINSSLFPNRYYINQQNIDPCNLSEEGIYFNTSKKDEQLLLSTYQSYVLSTGEKLSKEIREKLTNLSSALIWQVIINLPTKTGDLNSFSIYLAKVNTKILIAAIDTRNCGL